MTLEQVKVPEVKLLSKEELSQRQVMAGLRCMALIHFVETGSRSGTNSDCTLRRSIHFCLFTKRLKSSFTTDTEFAK